MILKQGRIVIHHFAHKPPMSCEWGAGETVAHMNAKRAFRDSLRLRGLRAEAEFVVDTMPGDRRADVMTWRSHDNQMVAFELQHTPVSLDEIESRATAYARARIAQIWIPFLRSEALDTATRESGGLLIARYSPRPFEKWVHGLHLGKMWMYDPREQNLWLAFLQAHKIWVEETSWYGEGGEEMNAGGYYRESKRYRDLMLFGPFPLDDLRIAIKTRKQFRRAGYNWPAGMVVELQRAPR